MSETLFSSGTRPGSESATGPVFLSFSQVSIDGTERPPNEIDAAVGEVERELEAKNGPRIAVAITDLADALSHTAASLRGLCPNEEPWFASVSRIHAVVRRLDGAASRAEGLAASAVTHTDEESLEAVRGLLDTCGTLGEAAEEVMLDAYGCDYNTR